MPVDGVCQAVDVFQELPCEPALPDAGDAGDRDEPGLLLASCGVQQVLYEPQLLVAADKRRLEAL